MSIRVPSELADVLPGRAGVDVGAGQLVPAFEIDNFESARTVITHSEGIGVAIPTQIEAQLVSGELELLDFPRRWLTPVFGFIQVKGRAVSPAAEVFMERVAALEEKVMQRNQLLIQRFLA